MTYIFMGRSASVKDHIDVKTAGQSKIVNTVHVPPLNNKRQQLIKMATKGKRPMRALTPGDKIDAIQRVNDGESKASVARDIGVPESTLRGWCKNEDKLRYMTSRMSSPDTDKSNDGEPRCKRSRTESPAELQSPANKGLDLAVPSAAPVVTPPVPPPNDAPVELTTKRAFPSPPPHMPRERRLEPGASDSMSAISPLSGLTHLPNLANGRMGLSFNEIASNITLLAQLTPGLSALAAQPQPSRALRSVRSPKPAHNGALNLSDSRSHTRHSRTHNADPYRMRSSYHGTTQTPSAGQSVDESLWYWFKTQQAMLDLTAQASSSHTLPHGKPADPNIPLRPAVATAPLNHLDYRNAWLWQYYKQFTAPSTVPDDKQKPASQIPKETSAENILYSQLTKNYQTEVPQDMTTSSVQTTTYIEPETRRSPSEATHVATPAASPEIGVENKTPPPDRNHGTSKTPAKARIVLDNLLYNNGNVAVNTEVRSASPVSVESVPRTAEALDHGDKFLKWLEISGDPKVTHMQVHQLRALLKNLRARRLPAVATVAAK